MPRSNSTTTSKEPAATQPEAQTPDEPAKTPAKMSGASVLAAARAAAEKRPTYKTAASPTATTVASPTAAPVASAPSAMPNLSKGAAAIEPIRFTVKREMETGSDGGSIKRIMLFIGVVVFAGIGLILLVENFISNNNSPATDNTAQTDTQVDNTTPEIVVAAAEFSGVVRADSQATNVISNDQFTTDRSALGSLANNVEGVQISKVKYDSFQSFSRVAFEMTGLQQGLPSTEVTYSAAQKQITVTFSGITVADKDLLQSLPVKVGNVQSITGSEAEGKLSFVLQLSAAGKYAVAVRGGNSVVIDIKTEAQLAIPTPETNPTEVAQQPTQPTPTQPEPSVPTSGAPAAPFFENVASKNKQYIVNNITGSNLISETYYYRDDPTSFLFSWAIRGVGEGFIPNATAEYITDAGVNYIEVKINNLSYDLLHSLGRDKAKIDISTLGSNLVDVFTKGFASGTATYWVEVRQQKDFKLYSTIDFNGYQLLTLELYD